MILNMNNNILEDYTIVLSTRYKRHLGQLNNVTDIKAKRNYNAANEISFCVHNIDDTNLWDEIIDLRLIYVVEFDEYYQIEVSYSEGNDNVKTITGTSLCEAELSETKLFDLEINTEDDIKRDDYSPTVFYNPDNPKASLLHRIFDKVPHYTINKVDESLMNLQRTFSIDNTDIYSFLTGEASEQFNCMFTFDTVNRSISAIDLFTVCSDCGYRGDYTDVCPECGSKKLKYNGNDTTILVSTENLTEGINYETDVNSIKNCFRLEAGDELMTSTVKNCNPNGSDYIYYFSEDQKRDMPSELVDRLNRYDTLMTYYKDEYAQISEQMYNDIDKIEYYRSGMMPKRPSETTTAALEAQKIKDNVTEVAMYDLVQSTSKDTVENAILAYAKSFIFSGDYKLSVGESTYDGYDSKSGIGYWHGEIIVTSYTQLKDRNSTNVNDEKDSATVYLDIVVNKVLTEYVEQRIQKTIAEYSAKDVYIKDILEISNLKDFTKELDKYCQKRIESFADAIQGVLDVLLDANQGSDSSELHQIFYEPYYEKLVVCEKAVQERKNTIAEYEKSFEENKIKRDKITDTLNFEKFLGERLYNIFCSYRREDVYSNQNFISDGLTNSQMFEKALQFIEYAKKEIVKSGEYQHTISANLYNLLAMDDFSPLYSMFELGNWIRVQSDNDIYRLRLISYEIDCDNPSLLNVEFSNLTKSANGMNDVKNILDSAKSMASSYSYVSRQAGNGNKVAIEYDKINSEGLNSALINIKNNNNEEQMIDEHGMWFRSYDDARNAYNPEQTRIVSNQILMTEDNWKTASLAIGKHNYTYYDKSTNSLQKNTGYGVSAKFLDAPYVHGGQIIGSEIYSENYKPNKTGSYIDLVSGSFSLGGNSISYNNNSDVLNLKSATITWGNVNAPEITDISGLENQLEQLDNRIETYCQSDDPSEYAIPRWGTEHNGDLWYDTTNSVTKMWNEDHWELTTDKNLEELAKSKAKVFTSQPTPPYSVGDLWVQGSNGDILKCKVSRTSGSYISSDWEVASKYTDDTKAEEALREAQQGVKDAADALARAQDAETNAESYADSAVRDLDSAVAKYFGLNGTTIIGDKYVISPIIEGGYLNITGTNKYKNRRVIIDPQGKTKTDYIFQVHDDNKVTFGVKSNGDTEMIGKFTTKEANVGVPNNITIENTSILLNINGDDEGAVKALRISTSPAYPGKDTFITSNSESLFVGHIGGIVGDINTDDNLGYFYLKNGASGYGHIETNIFNGETLFRQVEKAPSLILYTKDDTTTKSVVLTQNDSSTGGTGLKVDGAIYATGNLACGGTKYRVVDTENYGKVGMNSVESASAHFTDFGSGEVQNGNKCYIYIEDKFLETVDNNEMYQVIITRTSEAETSWVEKHHGYFIVHGENGATFDWMLIAKQKGYQLDRMEQYDTGNDDEYDEYSPSIVPNSYPDISSIDDELLKEKYDDSLVDYVIDYMNRENSILESEEIYD